MRSTTPPPPVTTGRSPRTSASREFSRGAGIAVLLLATSVGPSCRPPEPPAGALSSATAAAPELRPSGAAGVKAAVEAARGKVVLVNVWATWCEPCREEFPDLLRLRREERSRGLELILVSADFERQAATAQAFLREQGVDFPSLLKSGDDMDFIEGLEPRWSGSLPATFVYDRSGRLVEYWEGMADYETLRGKVVPLL
ncbi:MAG: redoxin domain-containing protein [Acidobacteriota bacterium]